MQQQQKGFTLVEIAIVLVIIGLLLGGILKGQELINSARVRNLADTTSGIQAAYFGFIDRYRRVPGDWNATDATAAIGVAITGSGNDNGHVDDGNFNEPNALWEQISKAGFISGAYLGTAGTQPLVNNRLSPFNPFGGAIVMVRGTDYLDVTSTTPDRLHLVVGRRTPVDVARELDVKLDDSRPSTGGLRAALSTGLGLGGADLWGGSTSTCTDDASNPAPATTVWNITVDDQDCNTVFLF